MYTFLMADDEEIIRKGFSERIAWQDYGFQFLPPCENGNEAIAAIDRYKPDVVLTDINMPGKDGLEVCAYTAEHYPETTLVILSGYDEFSYAQKAVSFNVFEYLLKPINAKKLKELIERLKVHLDKETSFKENISELRKQAEQTRELIRERLLNRLVSGRVGPEEVDGYAEDIGEELPGGKVCCILIDPDDPNAVRAKPVLTLPEFLIAVQNICIQAVPINGSLVFQQPDGNIIVILSGKTDRFIHDNTKEFIKNFYSSTREIPYSTLTLGIGTIKSSIEDIYQSYREAQLAVDYRFIKGRNTAIYYEYAETAEGRPLPALAEDFRQIGLIIKTAAARKIDEQISIFFSHIRESRISVYRAELEIQKYFITIISALEELDISLGDMEINSTSDPILKLKGMRTLEESESWIREFCDQASERLREKRQDFSEKKVYEAIDYMQANLAVKELSTDLICEELAISSGYLSRIFKKMTNMTILEYLMNIRVDRAKELVKSTDLRNYEIAEQVGYTDSGYFSTIFRKITGSTLSEYRQSIGT